MLTDVLSFLDGKKTHLTVLAALVVVGLQLTGNIEADMANRILACLGFTGISFLRAGVRKAQRDANGGVL